MWKINFRFYFHSVSLVGGKVIMEVMAEKENINSPSIEQLLRKLSGDTIEKFSH